MKIIFYSVAMVILLISIAATHSLAQTFADELKIGDTIPDKIWKLPLRLVNDTNGNDTVTLNEYRGKLIILDFWATWCGSCIKKFPEIKKLQNLFNDEIQFLGITSENLEKTQLFFKKKSLVAGDEYKITSIVDSKVFDRYFPHRLIPHYVWISGEGRVLAFTAAESITAGNIGKILNNKKIDLPYKKDLDATKPLFLSDDFPAYNELQQYSILSKGTFRGYPQGSSFKSTGNIVNGRSITNGSLLSIYGTAAKSLFEQRQDRYTKKRLILQIADSTFISPNADDLKADYINNSYNYSIVVPVEYADSLYSYMLQDLNRYTPYLGRIEKRANKCLVLIRTKSEDKIKSKGGKAENTLFNRIPAKLTNCPIDYLVNRIDALPSISLPLLNETNYHGNIDIEFSEKINGLDDLRVQLREYGLDLIETERNINMFVLSDKH